MGYVSRIKTRCSISFRLIIALLLGSPMKEVWLTSLFFTVVVVFTLSKLYLWIQPVSHCSDLWGKRLRALLSTSLFLCWSCCCSVSCHGAAPTRNQGHFQSFSLLTEFSLNLFSIFCIIVVEQSVNIYLFNCLQLKHVKENRLRRFWQLAYFSWNRFFSDF